MKISIHEAYNHIAPFVVQIPGTKDYKPGALQYISCLMTSSFHRPVMIRGFADDEAIKTIARMIIDFIDPLNGNETADIEYRDFTSPNIAGDPIMKHSIKFTAGTSTYEWTWEFTRELAGVL